MLVRDIFYFNTKSNEQNKYRVNNCVSTELYDYLVHFNSPLVMQ